MSPVPTISAWSDAKPYLEGLQNSVLDDVRPLLDLPGGAPFAVCREVLSYVDHLGHLYTGKGKVGDRFQQYLGQVMGQLEPGYGARAREIYEMFRNGTVHQFEPKVMENRKGERLTWLCYRGQRADETIKLEGVKKKVKVSHLEPTSSDKPTQFWLPVATNWLVNDLVLSIGIFIGSSPNKDCVKSWNEAARDLAEPVKPKKAEDFEWCLDGLVGGTNTPQGPQAQTLSEG